MVDNRGCKQAFSTTINPYKNPYVSSAISDSTSCFGLSDGEISNIEVKTNGQIQLDTLMNKRNEIFIPLLKEYTKNNYDSIIRSKYPWAPFIPYSFAEYGNSKPSVFYIGIDTYYWGTKPEDLIMAYNSNDYSRLFSKNDNVVTPERILKEWSSNKGSFWEFLCKMQLFFKDQRLRSTSDLRSLSIQEQKSIYEIGYGNANLLEQPKTLEKKGILGVNRQGRLLANDRRCKVYF